ncbi:uncharacterized protein LOC110254217 [Exaiptasia diaphana]|uniref:N-acetyltransferase domain-containing protein n=1 Tax=Exaiptasia diaphana TaxID=2652724 RepID=A0A913Y8L7_EXADI|nr:uncharacterized protein LOC110254217 [Exaiptasia diaphana]
MSIRLAVSSDASAIYDVHTSSIREICSEYYEKEEIKAWISRQNEQRYLEYIAKAEIVVMDNGIKNLKGFGHLSRHNGDETKLDGTQEQGEWDEAFVKALYVHPDHVGKGIGHQLLDHLQNIAQQKQAKKLTVFSTLNAISFYEKHGFKVIGMTKQRGNCANLCCTKLEKLLE